jgi:hypothetical protein
MTTAALDDLLLARPVLEVGVRCAGTTSRASAVPDGGLMLDRRR